MILVLAAMAFILLCNKLFCVQQQDAATNI